MQEARIPGGVGAGRGETTTSLHSSASVLPLNFDVPDQTWVDNLLHNLREMPRLPRIWGFWYPLACRAAKG